jgi:hypothetical protein
LPPTIDWFFNSPTISKNKKKTAVFGRSLRQLHPNGACRECQEMGLSATTCHTDCISLTLAFLARICTSPPRASAAMRL